MDEKNIKVNYSSDGGGIFIGLTLMLIFFVGEPDLLDALICFLMSH